MWEVELPAEVLASCPLNWMIADVRYPWLAQKPRFGHYQARWDLRLEARWARFLYFNVSRDGWQAYRSFGTKTTLR